MDWTLEVVILPVSHIDRSIASSVAILTPIGRFIDYNWWRHPDQ